MNYMKALLVSMLVPACAADGPATSTATGAAEYTKYEKREQIRCAENLCIIHVEDDADGDGIADADELAVGTDPRDPANHPDVADLAALVPSHALPSFEIGNSMLVLLPTMDANGLPAFGGDAALPARKGALEAAGISVPSSIDLARGISMTRSLGDTRLSFHGLFAATDPAAGTAQQVAGALGGLGGGRLANVQQSYEHTRDGITFGQATAEHPRYGDVTVSYERAPGYARDTTTSSDGSYSSQTTTKTDEAGNTTTTTTKDTTEVHETTLGGKFTTTTHQTTQSASNKDGSITYTTTTTTVTKTDPSGSSSTQTTTTTKSCNQGECTTGSGESTPAGEPAEDDGTATALRDPNYDGSVDVSPETLHAVLVARAANVNTGNPADTPLVTYDYTPVGVGNKWGPIALYGDDVGGMSPTFLHIPSATPDYDPRLQDGLPPKDAPPDNTCLYCFQP